MSGERVERPQEFGTGLRAMLERRAALRQDAERTPSDARDPEQVSPELILVCPDLRPIAPTP